MDEACTVGTGEGTCGEPAVQIMTTACMHGHTETFPVCEKDRLDAWNGVLGCSPCSEEFGVATRTFPQVIVQTTEMENPDNE